MAVDFLDDPLEVGAGLASRDQAHEAIEAAVEIGFIGLPRGVGQPVAAPTDRAGALEEALKAGASTSSPRRRVAHRK
jgi:hypothetical protein